MSIWDDDYYENESDGFGEDATPESSGFSQESLDALEELEHDEL